MRAWKFPAPLPGRMDFVERVQACSFGERGWHALSAKGNQTKFIFPGRQNQHPGRACYRDYIALFLRDRAFVHAQDAAARE